VSGGDGAVGGDRDGVGGEGARVELERGGDLQLADSLEQADADGRPPPWEGHGQQGGEIAWRPALLGDSGGAVEHPAGVGEFTADPLRLGRAGELFDQPQGAEHPRGDPGSGGDLVVLDIALAALP
jgi:hypothetical protein